VRNTSRRNIQGYSDLVGISYSEMDCWAIVREFYKTEMDTTLKSYYDEIPSSKFEARDLVYSYKSDFKKVEGPEIKGDILLIKLFGVESHIAVYLGNGRILHTSMPTGCVVDKLSKWERMISGTYRAEVRNVD